MMTENEEITSGYPIQMSTNELPIEYQLSFFQEREWLLQRMVATSSIFHRARAVQLTGPLDKSVLKRALQQMLESHELLRMTIREVSGEPHIEICSNVNLPWSELEFSIKNDIELKALDDLLRDQACTPFDLTRGPLLRAVLVTLGTERHLLLLVVHQLAADEHSLDLLIGQLAESYTSLRTGGEVPSVEPRFQYEAFAAKQRQYVLEGRLDVQLEYWKRKLEAYPKALELAVDHQRPSIQTFSGARYQAFLAQDLTVQLQALAARLEIGLSTFFLAGFAALLHRYTDEEDILIGITVDGRSEQDLKDVVGPLANTLVVRADLSGDPTFDVFIRRVSSACKEAKANSKLPFEVVLRALQPERDPSRSPVFQVAFGYERKKQPALRFADLETTPVNVILPASRYDLSLLVVDDGESLTLNFDYNPDLFEPASVERIAAHYQRLLSGITQGQSQPLSSLPLLTSSERHQLVVTWNETQAEYPRDICLHELIEAQVKHSPEHTAYTFQSRSLNYEQVNHKANQLAAQLRERGIGKGSFVPVLMDRSLELPLAILAVMKAGAAFVPLEVHWPVERIQHIVNDTESKLLLVNRDTPAFESVDVAECLLVDETELTESAQNLSVEMGSDDCIYSIYTSGSTGTPKGAVNRHRGIVNRLTYMTQRYGCMPQDVILQTSAHIYDAAVWQFFWPLINGARTIIPSPMTGFDFHHVLNLIEQEDVTITDFVPSVFNMLVDYLAKDETLRPKLATIRQILIGGEALNPKAIFQFKSYFPQAGITNTYGPTETSIGVIFYEVGDTFMDPLPIGRPIDNVHTYILDRHLNPTPVGIPGQLYVGGDCVGLGYLNDPQKTAAVFIDNPFTEVDAGKIYRTGDLARYHPDGNIEFLGRTDHQVKIRGVRIELGEIEAAIGRHPGVREAVVVVREDVLGDKRLVAYFIPDTEPAPPGLKLRTELKEKLPEYMIPHVFVELGAFPLTSSGKVNRRGLPKPEYGHLHADEAFVAPRTETEITLATIWEEVLGMGRVSLYDNFYEVGGDSLSAMKVLAKVKEKLGIFLDAEQLLFENLAQFSSSCSGQEAACETRDHSLVYGAGENIEPLFIGPVDSRLYGCYHIPDNAKTRKGVVFCYPVGHEYIRAHRSYRLLAKQLAEAGMYVLRFDYSGTGDSAGEFREGSVGHWLDDVNIAVEDMRERFGVEVVYLVGLRLGATLALQAAAKDAHINGLVLWDPVVSGREYLAESLALHNEMLRSSGNRVWRKRATDARPRELVGFEVSPALYDDLEDLDLNVKDDTLASRMLLIQSNENDAIQGTRVRLVDRGFQVDYEHIPSPQIWVGDPYKTLLPYKILQTVVTWITRQTL